MRKEKEQVWMSLDFELSKMMIPVSRWAQLSGEQMRASLVSASLSQTRLALHKADYHCRALDFILPVECGPLWDLGYNEDAASVGFCSVQTKLKRKLSASLLFGKQAVVQRTEMVEWLQVYSSRLGLFAALAPSAISRHRQLASKWPVLVRMRLCRMNNRSRLAWVVRMPLKWCILLYSYRQLKLARRAKRCIGFADRQSPDSKTKYSYSNLARLSVRVAWSPFG